MMDKPQITITDDFVPEHAEMFAELERDVAWEERIKKRKTASFGEPFNYSGQTYERTDMHPLIAPICDQLEAAIGFKPNNCLLNHYASGTSKMGFHVDATENLAPGSGVAIVSLGADRTITFRHKDDKEHRLDYRLKGGSMLYMPNKVQDHWLHAVLKKQGAGPRISLTFRQVVA